MSKAHPPELKKFMDKKLSLKLNGGRHVQGILRGFDPFMNLVLDECSELSGGGHQNNIGMVINNYQYAQAHGYINHSTACWDYQFIANKPSGVIFVGSPLMFGYSLHL